MKKLLSILTITAAFAMCTPTGGNDSNPYGGKAESFARFPQKDLSGQWEFEGEAVPETKYYSNTTRYAHLFDMKDSGDDFYFDNVTAYVRKVMADIEKLDFDEQYKREIRLTADLVVLGSEFCKVKLHPEASREKAKELISMIDAILPEYLDQWNRRNYERGAEKFASILSDRRRELEKL